MPSIFLNFIANQLTTRFVRLRYYFVSCRSIFSNIFLNIFFRSLEELARTLREEETISYLQDTTTTTTRAIVPSAPPGPPDIVTDLSSEETEPDTRQLVSRQQLSLVQRPRDCALIGWDHDAISHMPLRHSERP